MLHHDVSDPIKQDLLRKHLTNYKMKKYQCNTLTISFLSISDVSILTFTREASNTIFTISIAITIMCSFCTFICI